MKKYEPHELANLFPMMNSEEMQALIQDMRDNGYDKSSAIITHKGKILDGRNRYAAAETAKVEPVFVEYDGNDLLSFVISKNLHRRHLNETQRAGVAAKIANMQAGDNQHKTGTPNLEYQSVSIPQAAEMLNVGKSTVATYRAVAAAMPELVEKMDNGEITANKAWTEVRRTIVKNNLESVEAQEAKAIQGVYDVIVIDPPWKMEKIEREVAPNQVAFEYPTMTLDEIAQLEIPYAENCHIWLWTTQKFLPHAFGLFAAWDVKYVCTFNWHKNGGFQVVGLPQYNNEFVLYGRIGSPSFIDTKDFKTSFEGKRTGHSAKPEEFYSTVRRVTAGRRLDMFNRRKIEGFDGWGKESK